MQKYRHMTEYYLNDEGVEVDVPPSDGSVRFHATPGYVVLKGGVAQAQYVSTAEIITVTGVAIEEVHNVPLAEAHTVLTDGLTKAELVALGSDLGLTIPTSWLKQQMLDEIWSHLESLGGA